MNKLNKIFIYKRKGSDKAEGVIYYIDANDVVYMTEGNYFKIYKEAMFADRMRISLFYTVLKDNVMTLYDANKFIEDYYANHIFQ